MPRSSWLKTYDVYSIIIMQFCTHQQIQRMFYTVNKKAVKFSLSVVFNIDRTTAVQYRHAVLFLLDTIHSFSILDAIHSHQKHSQWVWIANHIKRAKMNSKSTIFFSNPTCFYWKNSIEANRLETKRKPLRIDWLAIVYCDLSLGHLWTKLTISLLNE